MMERISKILSARGICSRREADRYIEKGLVELDGVIVKELGTKASPDANIRLLKKEPKVTILMNKPVGYVSCQPEDGHPSALDLIDRKYRKKLAPCGRLDIDSRGLMIYTQDGVLAREIIGENSPVEKEYLVRYSGTLTEKDLALLRHGLSLDGKKLKPAVFDLHHPGKVRVVLREGKKRQIRRMLEMVGAEVTDILRIRVGRYRLRDLAPGTWTIVRQTSQR